MSKLQHASMKPTNDDTKPPNAPKTYVVDDPTQPPPTAEIDTRLSQFEASSAEKAGAEFDIPKEKPKSSFLEKLIFIGRLSEIVEIDGVKFEISTLTNKEHGEIIKRMYRFAEAADLFTVRVLTLSNAIRRIDGIALNDIDIDGEFEDNFHKRVSIVDFLQLTVVETLFDRYEKLIEKEEEVGEDDEDEVKN